MSATPRTGTGPGGRAEIVRIAVSMTVACAAGALILGLVYLGTDRYATASRIRGEQEAIREMLALDASDRVRVIAQYLDRVHDQVIYREAAEDAPTATRLVMSLDGTVVERSRVPAGDEPRSFEPLGRVFEAVHDGRPVGFVVEGETRGYKNRIRFFVALDSSFTLAGVRIVEHEEDPGLGAETATPWFQGQFVGRTPEEAEALDVTRDPMPEDWRSALQQLDRQPLREWRAAHADLIAREGAKPVYAVTGATISSRAVTDGVRRTVDHFRRRWSLIAPQLGGSS